MWDTDIIWKDTFCLQMLLQPSTVTANHFMFISEVFTTVSHAVYIPLSSPNPPVLLFSTHCVVCVMLLWINHSNSQTTWWEYENLNMGKGWHNLVGTCNIKTFNIVGYSDLLGENGYLMNKEIKWLDIKHTTPLYSNKQNK